MTERVSQIADRRESSHEPKEPEMNQQTHLMEVIAELISQLQEKIVSLKQKQSLPP